MTGKTVSHYRILEKLGGEGRKDHDYQISRPLPPGEGVRQRFDPSTDGLTAPSESRGADGRVRVC